MRKDVQHCARMVKGYVEREDTRAIGLLQASRMLLIVSLPAFSLHMVERAFLSAEIVVELMDLAYSD